MTPHRAAKYRTIVADPPWDQGVTGGGYQWRQGKPSGVTGRPLPYPTMHVMEIAALPVGDLADEDCALFVWTTNRYLPDVYNIVAKWGFAYSATLVWCKAPHGFNPGGAFGSTAEFVVYARRGRPETTRREQNQWWLWPRAAHSAKPDAFLDLVEEMFPTPRLEMFARRQRLGWDTWGNEALEHVEMAT